MFDINKIIKRDLLHRTDSELDKISTKISFYAVNPINDLAEKERFFKKKGYNPILTYEKYRENLEKLYKEISGLKTDKSVVGKILNDIKKSYKLSTKLLRYRGDANRFTETSIKLYGQPDKELVTEAKKLLKLKIKKEKKVYSSKDVKNRFRLAFLKYGFPWTVEEKDMVSNAAVKPSNRKLYIKKDARFSKNFVKRLIVHEIGTHAMRAENGAMQPYTFFRRGFPGYLMTEEGLAVINEEINNCLNNQILKVYAGRVIAIDCALKHSFLETYKTLRKHFGKDMSWRLTLRAKRGLSDTSLPGACTKDINYLKGYLEIKKFIKAKGDMNKLYYGKVGLQHIELLDKMHGLINPMFLPMFRYTNYLVQHFSGLLKSLIFFDLEPSLRFINNKLRWI
ncbi:DUF1704 domain-containing protein [Candidatus Woesearchaeota archaeon]|nr:DUF1704 domain-containing protein [Candidatus Woesearchaeota archaeon]